MRAVIYARHSSDNQREESIEGQLRECMQYAEYNDISVIDTYIDRALTAKPLKIFIRTWKNEKSCVKTANGFVITL